MRTHRTLATVALIVIATIGLVACVAINEAVTDRDLRCEATPDDLCVRIADLAVSAAADLDAQVDMEARKTMKVRPIDCSNIGRELTATRCWRVEGGSLVDDGFTSGFGRWVYERPDGTLGLEW